MCDYMRLDRSRNVVIRDTLTVNKMKEARLRWFDNIRRSMNALVRRRQRIVLLECRRC